MCLWERDCQTGVCQGDRLTLFVWDFPSFIPKSHTASIISLSQANQMLSELSCDLILKTAISAKPQPSRDGKMEGISSLTSPFAFGL